MLGSRGCSGVESTGPKSQGLFVRGSWQDPQACLPSQTSQTKTRWVRLVEAPHISQQVVTYKQVKTNFLQMSSIATCVGDQCFRSALVSMRIQLQQFMSMRIQIKIQAVLTLQNKINVFFYFSSLLFLLFIVHSSSNVNDIETKFNFRLIVEKV